MNDASSESPLAHRSSTIAVASVDGAPPGVAVGDPRSLVDLLYPGFYMIFLLRNGDAPMDEAVFRDRVRRLLANVQQGAQRLQLPAAQVADATFAFCALLDEIILGSKLKIRDAWERKPLQLDLFGEHLAGETFFDRLEALRIKGIEQVGVLEVFHLCLLLGFKGRYALEGTERLGYLTARLGDEIMHLQGRRASFAPHWAPPDRVAHRLRHEVPLWAVGSLFGVVALAAFLGLRARLDLGTDRDLAMRSDIVKLAPQPAYLTLTLP